MQQRPEGVRADSGQRGVNGGDGGIDDLASAFVEGVGGVFTGVFQPVFALVHPTVGFVVAGGVMRDAQEV